jgi:hypothetical protein
LAKPLPRTIFGRWFTTTGIITIAIIVTVGGATAIVTAAGDKSAVNSEEFGAAACRGDNCGSFFAVRKLSSDARNEMVHLICIDYWSDASAKTEPPDP